MDFLLFNNCIYKVIAYKTHDANNVQFVSHEWGGEAGAIPPCAQFLNHRKMSGPLQQHGKHLIHKTFFF